MAASAVASRCPSTSRILLTCRAECSVSSTGLRPQIYSGMPFHLQKLAFPVNIASHKHPHTLESSLLVDLYCPLIKRIDEEMEPVKNSRTARTSRVRVRRTCDE